MTRDGNTLRFESFDETFEFMIHTLKFESKTAAATMSMAAAAFAEDEDKKATWYESPSFPIRTLQKVNYQVNGPYLMEL